MNTEALTQGLHAIQMQSSSVAIVNNQLETNRATLSKALPLINDNRAAVKLIYEYCRYTDISVPNVQADKFLQWYKQREAYFEKAVELGYCRDKR